MEGQVDFLLDSMEEGLLPLRIDRKEKEVNKIEELEQRCAELENRVEALEAALVAALARSEKTVVVEGGETPLWYGGQ